MYFSVAFCRRTVAGRANQYPSLPYIAGLEKWTNIPLNGIILHGYVKRLPPRRVNE